MGISPASELVIWGPDLVRRVGLLGFQRGGVVEIIGDGTIAFTLGQTWSAVVTPREEHDSPSPPSTTVRVMTNRILAMSEDRRMIARLPNGQTAYIPWSGSPVVLDDFVRSIPGYEEGFFFGVNSNGWITAALVINGQHRPYVLIAPE
jgi:hypothetical protein